MMRTVMQSVTSVMTSQQGKQVATSSRGKDPQEAGAVSNQAAVVCSRAAAQAPAPAAVKHRRCHLQNLGSNMEEGGLGDYMAVAGMVQGVGMAAATSIAVDNRL
jgi:hypothetical protein